MTALSSHRIDQAVRHVGPALWPSRRSVVGFIFWAAAVAGLTGSADSPDLRWAAGLFLLAPLILMPAALALVAANQRIRTAPRLWKFIDHAQLPAAALLAVSFLIPTGALAAGALAVPWFGVTLLVAVCGLIDLWKRRDRVLENLCPLIGMIYLPIGGAWAVLSRWHVTVFGFSDIIILATAVHFHFAGFILPILTGKVLESQRSLVARAAAVVALIGIPALAAGITLSRFNFHHPEWFAALTLSVAAIVLALFQIRVALSQFQGLRRVLLTISALSLLSAMVMAILFAAGVFRGAFLWGIDIPWMLRYHAVINAFGYALCGLWAWQGRARP